MKPLSAPNSSMTGRFPAKLPPAWLLLACIGLIALNMRGPVIGVAPLVGTMQRELGFSPVEVGLLTSIPVLCFSLASPLASVAARRFGAEFAVTLTLLGVLAGVCLRSGGTPALALAGTVVIGLAITVGNIAVPLIIRRDVAPRQQGTAMGLYSAFMNVGAFATSVVMAPLAEATGWQLALASVGVLAVAAVAAWMRTVGARKAWIPSALPVSKAPQSRGGNGSWAWFTAGLTAGFAGQAFSYYGVTAWLPTYLQDTLMMPPAAAGAGSSIFQILAIVGALGVPLLSRFWSPMTMAVVLGVFWAAVPVGLLLAPGLWWLWSVFAGIAQGGGFTVIFSAIIRNARDSVAAAKASAVVQGVGYLFAALSPTIIGFVHTAAASWTPPLLVIMGSVLTFTLCTAFSVRRVAKQR